MGITNGLPGNSSAMTYGPAASNSRLTLENQLSCGEPPPLAIAK